MNQSPGQHSSYSCDSPHTSVRARQCVDTDMAVVEVEASGRIGPPSPHAKTTHKTHKYRKKEDNPQYVHMYRMRLGGSRNLIRLSQLLASKLQT